MKATHALFKLLFGLLVLHAAAKKRRQQSRAQKGSFKSDNRFEISPLPYPSNALEPYISQQTVEIIHGKLQADCIHHVNYMTHGNPDFDSDATLVDVVQNSRYDDNLLLYQNAAQCWNLSFFLDCMTEAYEDPPDSLKKAIKQDFGSFEKFKKQYIDSAKTIFGSGWTWLVYDSSSGELFITNTVGADNPFTINQNWLPVLAIDVWEHAYFLDYQNRRDIYTHRFLERLVDWDQVDENLANARMGKLNTMDDDDDDSEDDQVILEEEEDSQDENDEEDSGDDTASEL